MVRMEFIALLLNILLFACFALFFLMPRRKRDWTSLGMLSAFFVTFFFEMYGVSFTFFLLSYLLGVWTVNPTPVGLAWIRILSWVGVIFIPLGAVLVFLGWKKVYQGRGKLVTDGVYRCSRHPQYLGIILMATGFMLTWPTWLLLVMWPLLVVAYYRLARIEEKELLEKFGKLYEKYRNEVPMFIGWRSVLSSFRKTGS